MTFCTSPLLMQLAWILAYTSLCFFLLLAGFVLLLMPGQNLYHVVMFGHQNDALWTILDNICTSVL